MAVYHVDANNVNHGFVRTLDGTIAEFEDTGIILRPWAYDR
jgi:hypothetical protein